MRPRQPAQGLGARAGLEREPAEPGLRGPLHLVLDSPHTAAVLAGRLGHPTGTMAVQANQAAKETVRLAALAVRQLGPTGRLALS